MTTHTPLPYTGQTPMSERREFIKFLHNEMGVSVPEICEIYPMLSSGRINSIVRNKRGFRRIN
jgi:hypothetical protein